MKFWYAIAFAPMDQVFGICKIADQLGFEGVNLAHHIVTPGQIRSPYPYTDDNKVWWDPAAPFPDPWVLSAALSVNTAKLKFCPSIFILPTQDPFTVAKAVATAALISNNRLILGVGAGWLKEEFDLTGQSFSNRGKRMEEMLQVIELMISGKMVEFHGKYYDFEPVQMSPVPTERVPVYVGGHSPAALKRAATHADGWFGAGPYTPDEAAVHLVALREARQEAGTWDKPFAVALGLTTKSDWKDFNRLADLGATDFAIVPGYYTGNPNPSLDERGEMMEEFAREFIS